MGVQQASEGTTPQPAHQPSSAVNDVSDNLRAKLYVLCNRIGKERCHKIAITKLPDTQDFSLIQEILQLRIKLVSALLKNTLTLRQAVLSYCTIYRHL